MERQYIFFHTAPGLLTFTAGFFALFLILGAVFIFISSDKLVNITVGCLASVAIVWGAFKVDEIFNKASSDQ